ncbi:hypothetical protein [Glycomyces tenuis]|uniref:hypothetical protein n=1 Tax=Glycomyces tenuis TaxID=58116 RepID=UPI0004283D7C|nr:hypothetical protein [Glycomyces tenuis]
MRSYSFGTDFDELDPAVLAGFAPYLRTRTHDTSLVAVGTRHGQPVDAASWPLAALAMPGGCAQFGDYWTRSEAQALYLVAVTVDCPHGAAVIGHATAALTAVRPDLIDTYRYLVTGSGRWAYAHDLLDGCERLRPVAFHDDVTAAIEALSVRAAVRRWGELRRLRPLEAEAMRRVRSRAQQIQRERAEIDDHHGQTVIDMLHYQACASADQLSEDEAIALGIAAAANSDLRSWIVGRILYTAEGNSRMWCQVASYSEGTERAIAGALAALTAWTCGEDVAMVAAEAALEADEDCALAWTVWGLLETGISADSFDTIGLRAALPSQAGTSIVPRQRT